MKRPDTCDNEHLIYLDELRESGATNMYGARSYLMEGFPSLEEEEARNILLYWMKTFSERHNT